METVIIGLVIMLLLLTLGFVADGTSYDAGRDAGWEEGVKDVLALLPDEYIKLLAEEPVDPGMQMMIDYK